MGDPDPQGVARLYVTEGSGNSIKPALALHQLARPHVIDFVDVLAGQTRHPAYLAVNPVGCVPFFVDPQGFAVGESNAMLWYIAEGSPLMPDRADDRAQALQWLFFEQTRLEPNISPARFNTFVLPARAKTYAREIPVWRAKAEAALALLDQHLSGSRFVVKRHGYSVADIGVFGYVHLAGQAGIDLGRFRSVSRWIARVEATPRFLPIDQLLGPSSAHALAHRPARAGAWTIPLPLEGAKAAR